jgi:hypothetical protein
MRVHFRMDQPPSRPGMRGVGGFGARPAGGPMGPNVALNVLHSRGAERLTVLRRLQCLWAA